MNYDNLKRHSFRRVAILIQLVNDSLADSLLSKMSPTEAATVRRLAEELGEVDDHERERVIQDFLDQTGWAREDVLSQMASQPTTDGVEIQLSNSVQPHVENPLQESRMENPDWPDQTLSSLEAVDASPLGFVKAADVSIMVEMIQRESSSMGTVILSLMRPRVAAQTLEQFDLETRYDLLRRLADKGETHPDVSSEIVDMVQQEIESRSQPALTPGMQAVKKILETSQWNENEVFMGRVNSRREVNSADSQVSTIPSAYQPHPLETSPASKPSSRLTPSPRSSSEREKLLPLREMDIGTMESNTNQSGDPAAEGDQDGVLASKVDTVRDSDSAEPDLSPEYLVDAEQAKLIQRQFDAAGLHSMKNLLRVFKVLPPRIMSMAMTGAHPRMMVKVKKNLPRREASRLQYEIDHGGPIRLEDIILAQQAVLSALTHYEQHGSAFPAA